MFVSMIKVHVNICSERSSLKCMLIYAAGVKADIIFRIKNSDGLTINLPKDFQGPYCLFP